MQKIIDLTDIGSEVVTIKIPFVNRETGEITERVLTLTDISTAIVLGVEKIEQESQDFQKKVKDGTATTDEIFTFTRRKVHAILSQDNDITLEDVSCIPIRVLTKIMEIFNKHVSGIFLEGSPSTKPSGMSKNNAARKASPSKGKKVTA